MIKACGKYNYLNKGVADVYRITTNNWCYNIPHNALLKDQSMYGNTFK